MKPEIMHQEILLVTNSTLARREWCAKDVQHSKASTTEEQLEEACWNGLLYELLPGVIATSPNGKKLSLWQVIPFSSFLEIELSEAPFRTDYELSVNPYLFLPEMCRN